VSPQQINFLMPEGLATGVANFTISKVNGAPVTAIGAVGRVAPALYSMPGTNLAAMTAVRINSTGASTPLSLFDCSASPCHALPINLSGAASVYLTLYGTGIRNRSSLDNVLVTINGVSLPALYAGPQQNFAGLDQINVQLPAQLSGSGLANLIVKIDQHQANTVTVDIQ
jgi:uncharacterized protein (TIGR03437 family)